MERRKFVQLGTISAVLIGLSSSKAGAFAHEKLLGGGWSFGGGGGAWGAIAKDFKAGMQILAKQSHAMLLAIGDLAEAIGLRDEAAILRTEAKNIEGKGSLSADEMDAIAAKSNKTRDLVFDKMKASTKLTIEQKKKIAQAGAKYAPALAKGVMGAIKISSAASKVGGAGTPGITDGMEVISLAKDIPTLAPKAISFVSNAVEGGNKFFEAMREKGIETPDAIKMDL